MEFVQRPISNEEKKPERVGILPGTFNPPTIAHLELVYAAGFHVDEVVCVVPRVFPHKRYFGATLEQRLALLSAADPVLPYAIATSQQGLFIDIARECREFYGASAKLSFLCGADAAERIVSWDYGHPGAVDQMLSEFELLVAPRGTEYEPPPKYGARIHPLHIRGDHHLVSSTEVRERIQRGQRWEHLVPEAIVEQVREIYSQ